MGRRTAALGVLLGLLAAAPAGASSPGAGPALSVAIDPVHPQTVWAVGLGGLRKSVDGGATFRRVTVPVLFDGPPVGVIATAGGVLALPQFGPAMWSGDGGATWAPSPAAAEAPITRSPVDPAKLVAVRGFDDSDGDEDPARKRTARTELLCFGGFGFGGGGGPPALIASGDGGRTWHDLPALPVAGVPISLVLAGGGLIVTLEEFSRGGITEHVLRTTDLGAHWTDVSATFRDVALVVADATVRTRLWALQAGSHGFLVDRNVVRSDDLGSTWAVVGRAPGIQLVSTPAGLVDLSPPNACRAFSASTTGAGLAKSTDGGTSFAPDVAGLPPATGVVGYDRAGAVEVLATGYGVYHRSGGGAWQQARTRLGPAVVRDLVMDGDHLYAGTPDGAYVSRDRGRTWRPMSGVPAHADVQELAAAHGRVGVAIVAPLQAVFEGRAGTPLRRVRGVTPDDDIQGMAYEPSGSLVLATGNRLLRLRGTRLSRVHRFARFVSGLAVDGRGRILVAVAFRSSALLTSEDGGVTFGGRALPRQLFFPRVYAAGRGYYLDSFFTVGFSRDGRGLRVGRDFSFEPIDGSHQRISALPAHNRVAWAAGAEGIARSHDGGAHWQPYVSGQLTGATVVLVDGRELIYATLDKGVRRTPLVVGELTRPHLQARYVRDANSTVGRVRDHHLHRARVVGTLACGNSSGQVSTPVRGDGRFDMSLRGIGFGACAPVVATVTALDQSGNASRTFRFTVR